MNTPICDFVEKYRLQSLSRLHMPGHKGQCLLGMEPWDITEVEGADVLYGDSGIISQSMNNASSLFGTAQTLYSTEGSSLSIRSMLHLTALFAKSRGKKPTVLAGRNAHKAFISGAALNGIAVKWIYPEKESGLLSCKITPDMLTAELEASDEIPTALYITSPDYLGSIADISGLSRVCRQYGMLLLTDNAHGSYLRFLKEDLHPISLGADLCCDSAHKTLPVLTGGGYLHISKNAPAFFKAHSRQAMSLFASTSPSYLILQSLDMANGLLLRDYGKKLIELAEKVAKLKALLIDKGYTLFGDEPLKLTVCAKPYGYTGIQLAKALYSEGVSYEFADPDFTVLMLSPENTPADFERIRAAFEKIKRQPPVLTAPPEISKPAKALDIKEALFTPGEEINVENARGRILASYGVSCPPAVPVAICGELLDTAAIEAFKYYGIEKVRVIPR